ncbi:hypothetical protein, partial [Aeromonas sanarellii]
MARLLKPSCLKDKALWHGAALRGSIRGGDATSTPGTKKVHRGFPGKAALIFRKKYSESRNP